MLKVRAILDEVSRKYADRLLVVCPRATDAIAYAGELLQYAVAAEWSIRLLLLTERATGRSPVLDGRRERAAAALAGLGVAEESVRYCDVPVAGATEDLTTRSSRLLRALDDEVKCFQPTLIVAPSRREQKADYSALGVAVERAIVVRKASEPVGLAFMSHGDVWPATADDLFDVPSNPGRRERKVRALRLCLPDADGAYHHIPRERFLIVPGTPLDILRSRSGKDPLLVRTPARALRDSRSLCLLPADRYLDPAAIRVSAQRMRVALGGRIADALVIERTRHATEFRFSAPHGPVWIKGCDIRGAESAGWQRVESAPRQHIRRATVCCAVHCIGTPARCMDVLARTSGLVDVVVALDYGVNDEISDHIRRLSSISRDLRVIVVPRRSGSDEALVAAMRYALLYLAFDWFISLDAGDGHDPARIPELVSAVKTSGAELVVAAIERPQNSRLDRLRGRLFQSLLRGIYPHAPSCAGSSFRCHSRNLVARAIESLDDEKEAGLRILAMALDQGSVAGPDGASAPYHLNTFRILVEKVTTLSKIAASKCGESRGARQRFSRRGWS